METVYIAGGCLWGVQHFFDTVPGVQMTEAGRANGTTSSLDGPYDGYAECVKVVYDEKNTSISELMAHLFEIIDPYSPVSYTHLTLPTTSRRQRQMCIRDRGCTVQIPDIWKKQELL